MAVMDIMNRYSGFNSLNNQDENSDPLKVNALGESLAPSITQMTGQIPATDAENDQRTSWDFKQQAQGLNQILQSDTQDDENYYTSKHGNKYKKVDDSDFQQGLTAAAKYMEGYLGSGGSIGAGAKAAGQGVYNLQKQAEAFKKIDQLEDWGANPTDVDSYLNTLNPDDLQRNRGKWTPIGKGAYVNSLTGETRQYGDAQTIAEKPQVVDLGDRKLLIHQDGTREEIAKGATPKAGFTAAGANGGIGLDDEENQPQTRTDENGNSYYWQPFANGKGGKWTPYSATNQKQLNESAQANNPDANQQLVSSDLDTVNGATSEQINRFTGQIVGRSTTARDLSTSLDPDTRKVYQASERLGTQLGNAAISAAKAAGASGINTEAEIKRFTAGVPQPDYTSEANYKASMQKIQDYAENFKQNLIRSKMGPKANQQQQGSNHLTDDELLKKYGG